MCDRDTLCTDVTEIKIFTVLFFFLTGRFKSRWLNLDDLWDTSVFGVEVFRVTMSLRRFRFLFRIIRFDNRETRSERKKLIAELFKRFVSNCQLCYCVGECVTLVEKREAFRGRCSFIQYIPSRTCQIWIYNICSSRL